MSAITTNFDFICGNGNGAGVFSGMFQRLQVALEAIKAGIIICVASALSTAMPVTGAGGGTGTVEVLPVCADR